MQYILFDANIKYETKYFCCQKWSYEYMESSLMSVQAQKPYYATAK
jgi:hypothetical protein